MELSIASLDALNKKECYLYGEVTGSMSFDIFQLKPSTSQPKISMVEFFTFKARKVAKLSILCIIFCAGGSQEVQPLALFILSILRERVWQLT